MPPHVASQENVYPAEYDIPAERGGDPEAGPSDRGTPGDWSSEAGTGYRPSYLDSRYDDRPSERSADSKRSGRTWISRTDIDSFEDWD